MKLKRQVKKVIDDVAEKENVKEEKVKLRKKERIKSYIEEKIQQLGSRYNNYHLIKYYDNVGVSREDIDWLDHQDDIVFLYYEFSATKLQEAFEPFLQWIYEMQVIYSDRVSIDELFEQCNVYKPHRYMIKKYFETGIAAREEMLLQTEIDFEKKRFYDGLVRIFEYFAEIKPIVIILNKMQFAGISSIRLVNEMLKNESSGKIAIFPTYNEKVPICKAKKKIFNTLKNSLIEINCVFDWDDDEELMVDCDIETEYFNLELTRSQQEEMIKKIENMMNLFAIKQAAYYLGQIYYKAEVEKYDLTAELKYRIYKKYAKACVQLNRISDAYEITGNLKLLVNSNEEKFGYYIIKLFLSLSIGKYDDAEEIFKQLDEMEKYLDREQKAYVTILRNMSDYYCWRDAWLFKDFSEEETKVINLCKERNYKNIIAHMYIYGFDNNGDLYYKVSNIEERLKHFQKGIQIAEEMGNTRLLLDAYHKALITASSNGYIEVSDYFYKEKCMPICKEISDMHEEATCYIGLGYNRNTREEHDKANEYFNKALIIYYSTKDLNYLMETLYNMSTNAILGDDFKSADSYISVCLNAVEKMNRDGKIGVCHITKLYGLKALCCYRLNNTYKCKMYLSSARRILDYAITNINDIEIEKNWADDLFLFNYVTAMVLRDSKKYDIAEEHFDRAHHYAEKAEGNVYFSYCQCMMEIAKLYMEIGRKSSAIYVLEQAADFCRDNFLNRQKIKVLEMLGTVTGKDELSDKDYEYLKTHKIKWEMGSFESSLKGITINDINDVIDNVGVYNRSVEEKTRSRFLTKWTKILNASSYTPEEMIELSIKSFKNNFGIDEIIYIRMENDKPVLKFSNADIEITDEIVSGIYEYTKANMYEFAVSRIDSDFYEYEGIMKLFDMPRIASFTFVPIIENEQLVSVAILYMVLKNVWNSPLNDFMLNNEYLSLFVTSFRQMEDAVERQRIHGEFIRMNKKLHTMALKDNLTGLYNRQGLQYNIDNKIYQGKGSVCAILYMDLDNFKYYNDNFGHEIGDIILVAFSDVINNICDNDGFAVRYGGDEFLIILYLDNKHEAEEAAESIYKTLEEEKAFKNLVDQAVGYEVDIPREYWVSCSIGIACFDNSMDKHTHKQEEKCRGNEFEDALKRADDTLYYIKRTKKGRYETWDSIKEFL